MSLIFHRIIKLFEYQVTKMTKEWRASPLQKTDFVSNKLKSLRTTISLRWCSDWVIEA